MAPTESTDLTQLPQLTVANTLFALVVIRSGVHSPQRTLAGAGDAVAATPTAFEVCCDGSTRAAHRRRELRRRANPLGALALVRGNEALWTLSLIVFFYYLSLWGFIANSLLYARRRFHLTPPAALWDQPPAFATIVIYSLNSS